MMVLGTWFGGWAGWHYGPWAALLFGALGGALGGLLHALATVTFGVNQIVSGIAINLIAPGVTRFLSSVVFAGHARRHHHAVADHDGQDRDASRSRGSRTFLDWLNKREWFLVSDASGVLVGFTKGMAYSTLIAWLMRADLRLRPLAHGFRLAPAFGRREAGRDRLARRLGLQDALPRRADLRRAVPGLAGPGW